MKKPNFNLNFKFLNDLREKTETEARKTRSKKSENIGENIKHTPKLAFILAASVLIFAITMFIVSIKYL